MDTCVEVDSDLHLVLSDFRLRTHNFYTLDFYLNIFFSINCNLPLAYLGGGVLPSASLRVVLARVYMMKTCLSSAYIIVYLFVYMPY